ncbi:hypothetical protein F442_19129 [Phytophthora nicotianae P10297]|uniref:Retrotransposon gag domain-containing protein n=1 Tax=Phytophthora nicotianae P10297 TaxID=1317064 RepID=W2YD27_PHYNI|nr:hypothetical protein F442_19129 [Phytophthora nicotianae P10297]
MDSTNEAQVPGTEGYAEPRAMPNQQYQETPPPAASAQAAMPAGPPPPAPQPGPAEADASGTAQMLASLQTMATSQQQMHTFMAQQKQKANPPKFHGRADDDLELWLLHIEEHFAAYTLEMEKNDSRFVEVVVPFLDVDIMAWYGEFKHAIGTNPVRGLC